MCYLIELKVIMWASGSICFCEQGLIVLCILCLGRCMKYVFLCSKFSAIAVMQFPVSLPNLNLQ